MQSIWVLLYTLPVLFYIGLLAAIIMTIVFLFWRRLSSNAWKIAAAAAIMFFIGGNFTLFLDGNLILTWVGTFATVAGYLLLALTIDQFIHDRREAVAREQELAKEAVA